MLSVGEILKQERLKKGYTFSFIEKKTKIREKFLIALEQNDWVMFSSKIYITGIIKNYAAFLGLDAHKLLAFFRREYEKKDEIRFKRRVKSSYFASDTKAIVAVIFTFVFLAFFLYFGYQLFQYLKPPSLLLIEPKSTVFKRIAKIKIIGKTEKDSHISIFSERIYQNKDGFFEYDFPLKVGKNTLTVDIIGANGKKTSNTYSFFRQQ